jgi:hypothetical protein
MRDDFGDLFSPFASSPQAEVLGVQQWLAGVTGDSWLLYAKRLSANDTLLNRSHQYGPYVPKRLARIAFPEVTARHTLVKDPDTWLHFSLDSHGYSKDVRLVWYNDKVVTPAGTRNESRITQWGGRESPLLDPDATGALCVFAFALEHGKDAKACRAWLCRWEPATTAVEDALGPVEPGKGLLYSSAGMGLEQPPTKDRPCWLTEATMPQGWQQTFPPASEIVEMSIENVTSVRTKTTSADQRLLSRRACEYEIFKSVETAHVLPRIKEGFGAVEIFMHYANIVTNRRKSRAGASLELQASRIFEEDSLPYERGPVTEGNRRPDFLFPSSSAYHDPKFPPERLRVLAAKTTCKDRWRQILNEASRVSTKHLLTLQEGVSPNQWKEMHDEGVVLVVPKPLHSKYPPAVRSSLLSLDQFISETRSLSG